MAVVLATIKVRGDSAANWASVDPVLANRELGLDETANKLKRGDGVTPWSALPYLAADVGSVAAADVEFTPAGNIASSDVQAAIEELDSEKASTAALAAKLDASAVSGFGATLIEDADAATARATLGLGDAATEDYEEGTFTPGVTFGGGNTGLVLGAAVGRYTKVGRLVTVMIRVQIATLGSSTGALAITGLPFAANGSAPYALGQVMMAGAGLNSPVPFILSGATQISIYNQNATTWQQLTDANCPTGATDIYLSLTYDV